MTNIFIDTSAFYASLSKEDVNHLKAVSLFKQLKIENHNLVITNHIFAETLTLIRSRLGIESSINVGKSILQSQKTSVIHVDPETEQKAWRIFSEYNDKFFSFIDCISFAVMKENNIAKAFTFDKHFKQFGFEVLPQLE